MAEQVRNAYSDVYQVNEYAHELDKEELISKLRTLTSAGEDDRNIPAVASTFLELGKLADFSLEDGSNNSDTLQEPYEKSEPAHFPEGRSLSHKSHRTNFGISYTINLNLPATTDIEVFNAIFKSLKEKDTPISIRSDDPLSYTNFGELIDILNANGSDFFDTIRSQRAMQQVLIQFNSIRNVIAYSNDLSEDEIVRLKLLIKDWFRIQG